MRRSWPLSRAESTEGSTSAESETSTSREDDVLPGSLYESVLGAASKTADAFDAGAPLALAELLVPELFDVTSGNIMGQQGDQERMWELTREFSEQLQHRLSDEHSSPLRSVYPDAGAAALLQSTWADQKSFQVSSLNEPDVLANDPACIVLACPDPPSADKAISISCALMSFMLSRTISAALPSSEHESTTCNVQTKRKRRASHWSCSTRD